MKPEVMDQLKEMMADTKADNGRMEVNFETPGRMYFRQWTKLTLRDHESQRELKNSCVKREVCIYL